MATLALSREGIAGVSRVCVWLRGVHVLPIDVVMKQCLLLDDFHRVRLLLEIRSGKRRRLLMDTVTFSSSTMDCNGMIFLSVVPLRRLTAPVQMDTGGCFLVACYESLFRGLVEQTILSSQIPMILFHACCTFYGAFLGRSLWLLRKSNDYLLLMVPRGV
jgi:hypothetical protein